MDKTEFIEILRSQLSGQMPEGAVAAHVRYYEDYIQSQINSGRTEEEVLSELGAPRLIAKTLVDAGDTGESEAYESYQEYSEEPEETPKVKVRRIDLSTWYGKAIVIVCAVAIVAAAVALIGTILPFVIALALILSIFSWLKKRR